jgi:hypothetical protein
MGLVQELDSAKAYIVIRPASASPLGTNGTVRTAPQPDNVPRIWVFWDPNDTSPYEIDNIARVPCGTLIHELKHASDILAGVITHVDGDQRIGEPRAVQIENLYYWRRGLPQRRYYYPWPDPLPTSVLWGTAQKEPAPSGLVLTVVNATPELILVGGPNQDELLCGGRNPFFRARTTRRRCAMRVASDPTRNPYAVPLVSLAAFFPSGDPTFPRTGRVVWTDDRGNALDCGGNAFSEYCQVAMGEAGSTTGRSPVYSRPASRMIRVRYETGGLGVAD